IEAEHLDPDGRPRGIAGARGRSRNVARCPRRSGRGVAAAGQRTGRHELELTERTNRAERHDAGVKRGTFRLTGGRPLSVFTSFMKVVSSIKSAKKRHPACQVVRRKGKIYVINKVEPRYK